MKQRVRVRFAPSPTGYLHIGGARTALYSFLYAKAMGGSYILRIEDTDQERSKREYEEAQIDDLKWLGIEHDEGPDKPGEYGPYRQSDRLDYYNKYAKDLVESNKAYPCFLTQNELDELTQKAKDEKKSPHAYHGKFRDLDPTEAKKRVDAGEEHVIRFKNPGKKWEFTDIVRGNVKFPEDMVGDFVIIRSNGLPVYNFCCVIDDHLMKMTHIIRAEEHLNNTVRQLMIYDAIGAQAPEFAHVSLLVGEDRQKLSKRHGATSVSQYREQQYLPDAINNYLLLLGWSHPEEKDIFNVHELGSLFDLKRFTKAPALYDIKKLNHFNSEYIKAMDTDKLCELISANVASDSLFNSQSGKWKLSFSDFFKDKLTIFTEVEDKLKLIFNINKSSDEEYLEASSWETTPVIKDYIVQELAKVDDEFISVELIGEWMNHLKKELKIKGKPLFMGMRVVLTGSAHGPDLKVLTSLTPIEVIRKRLNS